MAAIIAALIGAAVVGGTTAYGATQEPGQPNLAASSAGLSNVEAQMLPIERQLTSAANEGSSVTVNMPAHQQQVEQYWVPGKPITAVNPETGKPQTYESPGTWQTVANGASAPAGAKTRTSEQAVKAGPQTFDFSGLGSAEVQTQLQQQLAGVRSSLQQQYGTQFASEALQQEQQAEPQQFAARQQEYNQIEGAINTPFVQPASNALDSQVQSELSAAQGHTLDPLMRQQLMSGVSAAEADRGGGNAGSQDFSAPLTSGFAGEQQQLGAIQAATGELGAGVDPTDIAYRHQMQNLSDLGAFANSETPESEFSSLSGAGNGAAPFNPGGSLPQLPGNSQGAQQAALQSWQSQLQAAESQSAPWMAGLSGALGIGNTVASLSNQATQQNNFSQLLAGIQAGG